MTYELAAVGMGNSVQGISNSPESNDKSDDDYLSHLKNLDTGK